MSRRGVYGVDVATRTRLPGSFGSGGRDLVVSSDSQWVFWNRHTLRTSDLHTTTNSSFVGERGVGWV